MNVVILRGIPGSGKTSYIGKLTPGKRFAVCSADDYHYHIVNGVYKFDPASAPHAHNCCLKQYVKDLQCEIVLDLLIVDNTNLAAWEIAPYYRLAEANDFPVKIVRMHCPFEVAAKRNIHDVPVEKVWAMHQILMADKLPLWWKEEFVLQEKET